MNLKIARNVSVKLIRHFDGLHYQEELQTLINFKSKTTEKEALIRMDWRDTVVERFTKWQAGIVAMKHEGLLNEADQK